MSNLMMCFAVMSQLRLGGFIRGEGSEQCRIDWDFRLWAMVRGVSWRGRIPNGLAAGIHLASRIRHDIRHPLSARGNVAAPGDGQPDFLFQQSVLPAVPARESMGIARDVQRSTRTFDGIPARTDRLAIPIAFPAGQE